MDASQPKIATTQPAKRKYTKRKTDSPSNLDESRKKMEKDVIKSHISSEAKKILEKWMYDHRFYCYPMKDEKQLLALETGLTIEKVSNWFINSRRRLLPKMLMNEGKLSNDFTISRKRGKESRANNDKATATLKHASQYDAAYESSDDQLMDSNDGYLEYNYEPKSNLSTIAETSLEYHEYEEVYVPISDQTGEYDLTFDVDTVQMPTIQVTRGILYDEATQQKCLFLVTY